ncbi:MAG: hypothetical protein K0R28_6384 [Paenibacillus sp.]|nr:hypothetical protein [Paenibacillus sp.]
MVEQPIQARSTSARLDGCWTTYLGAAYGVLTAAGMTSLTLPEMAGMTGMAFQLYAHKRCKAASVTVYDWAGRHLNALDRIGILSETYHYEPGMRSYEAARKRAVSAIKMSIDRGIAVIAWAIDGGEFGVIYGYDDEDGIFLVDGVDKFNRPFGSDPMLYDNIGAKFPPAPILHYQIPLASVDYDREETYLDSLRFYVREMEKPFHVSPEYHSGLLAYEHWIHALNSGEYDSFGLRYMTSVFAEAKRMAAQYVKQLADTWGGLPGLADAADRFDRISSLFNTMMTEVLAQDWHGAKHLGKLVSPDQAKRLVPLLRQARSLESECVNVIKNGIKDSSM